jgi:tRNA A37 threonylcarbamoyladenosine biosynthesis protein TsaE
LNEVIKSENTKQKLLQNADYVQVDDVCVVEWDKEGADFQMTSSNHCRGFGSREDQDIEVIGNIYENKDLVH